MQHFGDRIEFIRDYLSAIFGGFARQARAVVGRCGARGHDERLVRRFHDRPCLGSGARLADKHAIKQVDRLLSNQGVVVWDMFAPWVAEMVGQRRAIVVAMDWTDFDADNQTTLALHLVTGHGRATPLFWLTVDKDELKNKRNDFEDPCLSRLEALPEGVAVTILADRGFGDVKLFAFLENWALTTSSGFAAISMSRRTMARRGWPRTGSARADGRASCATPGHRRRARSRRGRLRPRQRYEGGLVFGHQPRRGERARNHQLLRQALDDRAGVSRHEGPSLRHGHGCLRIADPQRRDRLLLLNAFAIVS